MTASTVWINGERLGEYKGGYTPFSFDLTPHIDFDGENLLAVDVDSSERPDIPPFGYQIDYLTFVASTARFLCASSRRRLSRMFCQAQRRIDRAPQP